jgi:N-acetylmuramoyl-L-alanine amidase
MCDACEHLLHPASTRRDVPDPAPIDRRRLLRQAGVGGLAALAAAIGLPDTLAEAMAPPFETLQLGEDGRPALAVAAPGAVAATSGGVPSLLPGVPAAKKSHHSSGISTPHIVTRAEWGADESIRTSARGFAPIRKFVVHHTASPNNPRHPVAVMQEMYQYHVLGRGFSDVGYNFAIDQHGTIYEARWARNYAPGELPRSA